MSFGKSLGMTILLYMVLNFVFVLIFVLVGGYPSLAEPSTPVSIGGFFSDYAGSDIMAFITLLLAPGGGSGIYPYIQILDGNFISSVQFYLGILNGSIPGVSGVVATIGLLWSFLPGLLAALIVGMKFAEEDPKSAYFAVFVAIVICAIIPMVLGAIGQLNPSLPGTSLTVFVPTSYLPGFFLNGVVTWAAVDYINVVLLGVFSGAFYAGFAAVGASNI